MRKLRLVGSLVALVAMLVAGCTHSGGTAHKPSQPTVTIKMVTPGQRPRITPTLVVVKNITAINPVYKRQILAGASNFNPALLAAMTLAQGNGTYWRHGDASHSRNDPRYKALGAYGMVDSIYRAMRCRGVIATNLQTDTACAVTYLTYALERLASSRACAGHGFVLPRSTTQREASARALSHQLPSGGLHLDEKCSLAGLLAIWSDGPRNFEHYGFAMADAGYVTAVLVYYGQLTSKHLMPK